VVEQVPRTSLTVFGATVLELMSRRGLRTWVELSRLLAGNGYDFKPPRISNWVHGRHPVSRDFGRALIKTLNLSDDEITELARAFLMGQRERVTGVAPTNLR
jgi:hypothetical protein